MSHVMYLQSQYQPFISQPKKNSFATFGENDLDDKLDFLQVTDDFLVILCCEM